MGREIVLDSANQEFKIFIDGSQAGRLTYTIEGTDPQGQETWVLDGTEVDPAHRGKGVAGDLVEQALKQIRERQVLVVPTCPYVVDWFQKNPDHRDLLSPNWSAPWEEN